MTGIVPGDPASVSALAGELTRLGEELRERRATLARIEAQLEDWGGVAAESFRTALRTQVRALEDSADSMSGCGSALQEYAVDLQHARARAAEAHDYCERHGLRLEPDGTVTLPWGQYDVEDAERWHDSLPEGQRLARLAIDSAEDAAQRLANRVAGPVQTLRAAGSAALGAVTAAASAAQGPPRH